MNKELRTPCIAGNWKMNKNAEQAAQLIAELKPLVSDIENDTVICVPFTDIAVAVEACAGTKIKVGAQNVHFESAGAYTGEISADMLVSAGVEYVVIGHSERRQYFGETNETVNKRTLAAIKAGLKVILCVGEMLYEREQGITDEIVALQTKIALQGVSEQDMKNVIIAYEPVWAIGTGVTATADEADETCGVIRGVLSALYSEGVAQATTIQYGGSMKPANADELLAKEHVDGGLIGGASLLAQDFSKIIKAAE